MDALAHDVADHEIVLGNLHPDLVSPRSSHPKYLCRLLHPIAVQAHPWNRSVVRDEILRDEPIQHAPIARLVGVDRLDIASDQVLVLLS